MIATAYAALLLMAATQAPMVDVGEVRIRIRERIIARVPVRNAPETAAVEWRERKGPRCVPLDIIAGAAVRGSNSVDLILRSGRRLRAKLDSACPALDFYAGFYVRSSDDDQMMCAGRDSINARSGGDCAIVRFRLLEAKPRR